MSQRWSNFREFRLCGRRWLYLLIVAFSTTVLGLLGSEIVDQLSLLKAAPTDNAQWSLSQLEIEMLVLAEVADKVAHREAGPDTLRTHFNIAYSRVSLIQQGAVFADLMRDAKPRADVAALKQALDAIVPVIDGPEAELLRSSDALVPKFRELRMIARPLALDGVAYFARESDAKRSDFSSLLLRAALVTSALIVALVSSILVLVRQFGVSTKKSDELRRAWERFSKIIEVSIDPIIVADEQGRILDLNPAAVKTFGHKTDAARGADLVDLIVAPIDRERYRQALGRMPENLEPSDHSEGMALRANGETFPIEYSVGMTAEADRRLTVVYLRDISQQVETQRELTIARDQALAAAKARSKFIAITSHEMRTPLNGVVAVLDLLEETELTPRQRDYVRAAIASGGILQHHIDDVLDITRIESNHLELSERLFDLRSLLVQVAELNEPAARGRATQLILDNTVEHTHFIGDEHRLRQVLLNLLGNAVKFTECGTVRVEARVLDQDEQTSRIELAVVDSGIGIAAADVERIFEDFVTLDPSYHRTNAGYGLGLAICRRIVQAMGGEVAVQSKLGEGSRFSVHLNMRRAHPQQVAAVAERRTDRLDDCSFGYSVLLVEDNETNRFVAREMLERAGCTVVEAVDGAAGIDAAGREEFDLILMDVSMPHVDGLDATIAIRASDGPCRDRPIVGLTAHALPEEREKLYAAGMVECLIKPLRVASLISLLGNLDQLSQGSAARVLVGHSDVEPEDEELDVLDLGVLSELSSVLTEDELRARLNRFCEELVDLAPRLKAFSDKQNVKEMGEFAHRVAGSASIFGAARLRHDVLELERVCLRGETDALPEAILRAVLSADQTCHEANPDLLFEEV